MPMKDNHHSMKWRNDKKSTPLSPEVSNIASTIENNMTLKKHWVTILGWGGTILGMAEYHPCKFLPGVSFVSNVQMPNSKNVVHFPLVGDHPWGGG